MTDNPLDSMHRFDRVSVRAVLVHDGEDPTAALSEAGIIDPIAIPVLIGEDLHPSGGVLGDGITPNLTAVLETEQEDDFDSSPYTQPKTARRGQATAQPDQPGTTTLPAAFGMQPLAPVRRFGGTG